MGKAAYGALGRPGTAPEPRGATYRLQEGAGALVGSRDTRGHPGDALGAWVDR